MAVTACGWVWVVSGCFLGCFGLLFGVLVARCFGVACFWMLGGPGVDLSIMVLVEG